MFHVTRPFASRGSCQSCALNARASVCATVPVEARVAGYADAAAVGELLDEGGAGVPGPAVVARTDRDRFELDFPRKPPPASVPREIGLCSDIWASRGKRRRSIYLMSGAVGQGFECPLRASASGTRHQASRHVKVLRYRLEQLRLPRAQSKTSMRVQARVASRHGRFSIAKQLTTCGASSRPRIPERIRRRYGASPA